MPKINHLHITYNTKVEGYALLHALDQSYRPLYFDINLQK